MHIDKVRLKGYRNFKNTTVHLTEKSLMIGSNDVGKTNFLYALRILLDRNLSDLDVEPKDSDFFVYENTNKLEISIEFQGVKEDCVLSKLKEHVSATGNLVLAYRAQRNPSSKRIVHGFWVGPDRNNLTEIDNRFYLKVLNLKFIASKRDLFAYIRQERRYLLQEAKEKRSEQETEKDSDILLEIEGALDKIGQKVKDPTYIDRATESINTELDSLSFHNQRQDVVFDAGASDPTRFVDELRLASRVDGKSVIIGGDGRNNQIHLALWSARNKMRAEEGDEPLEVNIFCIEEPEAHLHPHQQRKLAQYLSDTLQGQVIITTHSPQVACEFPPASIVRLYNNGFSTLAAGNGVNPFTEAAFIEFGYRLNVIPAEAFFADVVFLVEGPSEELFYKALSKHVGVDLDRFNISVLMVDGVGFKPYISLLRSLSIPFVVRTDNDVFKVPNQDAYRLAGVQRALEIYKSSCGQDSTLEMLLKDQDKLQGFTMSSPPQETLEIAGKFIQALERVGIYVSEVDLEHDLHSALPDITSTYFGLSCNADIIVEMQKRKATFMFDFLREHSDKLALIKGHSLAKPLLHCQCIAEANYGINTNS